MNELKINQLKFGISEIFLHFWKEYVSQYSPILVSQYVLIKFQCVDSVGTMGVIFNFAILIQSNFKLIKKSFGMIR